MMMRILLLASASLLAFATTVQTPLPAPLTKHFQTLADAGSLTVTYTVQPVGKAKSNYKLVLSKPGVFLLTTPTGMVESDGKVVTTYNEAKKKYTEEAVSDAWIAGFARRPEVLAWGAFLQKLPAESISAAKLGASRTLGGNETTEVELTFKKGPSATLFVDKKLSVARGGTVKVGDEEFLILASAVEVSKDALPAEKFAFKAPAGAEKEEVAAKADFADVQALMNDKCLPCHSDQNAKAGVITTNYDGIAKIVVPGSPDQSQLIKSVKASGNRRMPKNRDALSDAEIKLLETWITNGAKK